MHDYEYGHDCPKCGMNSICTIEDGFCENQGTCNECLRERYYEMNDSEENSERWAY
jgi:hypothetical protein